MGAPVVARVRRRRALGRWRVGEVPAYPGAKEPEVGAALPTRAAVAVVLLTTDGSPTDMAGKLDGRRLKMSVSFRS